MAAHNLPLLPGLSPSAQLGKSRFHKSQGFVFHNSVPTVITDAPVIGGAARPVPGVTPPKTSVYPRADGPAAPAWLAFDRQVLCFNAYFQEAVTERRDEQSRIRLCKIYFYLEDDTMQVVEPVVSNSSLPQGTLVRRHRIPKPAPSDDRFFTVDDLNVGNEITIYGRTFVLFACDAFSKAFLTKLGVRVGDDITPPVDAYSSTRKAMAESMQAHKPYEKHDMLGQFLANDRKVLRFYCVWDDTESAFGDRRYLVLLYYLADDSVSIHEVLAPNAGRDTVAAFLHRQKLPKDTSHLVKHPGQTTPRTVLNVFGPTLSGRHILDNIRTGSLADAFYNDADLTIGAVVEVYGRRVLLCDCDAFTKEYFTLKYGLTDFTAIEVKDSVGALVPTELPPFNGFGTEEDSIQNCLSLLPQPPLPRRGVHLAENTGLERAQLRYVASLDSKLPQDSDRRFIITFHLVDDTISIFEQRQRNSGMVGGKFLERKKHKGDDGAYLNGHDLVVGSSVLLGGHRFNLLDADEFAYNFFFDNKFPESDPTAVIARLKRVCPAKLAAVVASLKSTDPERISNDKFEALLRGGLGADITMQNIRALERAFHDAVVHRASMHRDEDIELLVSQIQSVLAKKNYNNFTNLHKAFLFFDKDRKGCLSRAQVKHICFEYNLPVDDTLLDALIARMPTNDAGGIDYHAFAKCLHYTTSPAIQQSSSFTSNAAESLSATLRSSVLTTRGTAPGDTVDVQLFTQACQ